MYHIFDEFIKGGDGESKMYRYFDKKLEELFTHLVIEVDEAINDSACDLETACESVLLCSNFNSFDYMLFTYATIEEFDALVSGIEFHDFHDCIDEYMMVYGKARLVAKWKEVHEVR